MPKLWTVRAFSPGRRPGAGRRRPSRRPAPGRRTAASTAAARRTVRSRSARSGRSTATIGRHLFKIHRRPPDPSGQVRSGHAGRPGRRSSGPRPQERPGDTGGDGRAPRPSPPGQGLPAHDRAQSSRRPAHPAAPHVAAGSHVHDHVCLNPFPFVVPVIRRPGDLPSRRDKAFAAVGRWGTGPTVRGRDVRGEMIRGRPEPEPVAPPWCWCFLPLALTVRLTRTVTSYGRGDLGRAVRTSDRPELVSGRPADAPPGGPCRGMPDSVRKPLGTERFWPERHGDRPDGPISSLQTTTSVRRPPALPEAFRPTPRDRPEDLWKGTSGRPPT